MINWFMNLKVGKLVGIAGVGGVMVGAMATLLKREEELVTKGTFMESALKIVKDRPEVTELMGDFKFDRPNLRHKKSCRTDTEIQVVVPISGDKDNGEMFFKARRKDTKEKYKLYRLELTFDKIEKKKMILLDLDENKTTDKSLNNQPKLDGSKLQVAPDTPKS